MTFEKGVLHCSASKFHALKTYTLDNSLAHSLKLLNAPIWIFKKVLRYEKELKEIVIETTDHNTFETIAFAYDPFLRGLNE